MARVVVRLTANRGGHDSNSSQNTGDSSGEGKGSRAWD